MLVFVTRKRQGSSAHAIVAGRATYPPWPKGDHVCDRRSRLRSAQLQHLLNRAKDDTRLKNEGREGRKTKEITVRAQSLVADREDTAFPAGDDGRAVCRSFSRSAFETTLNRTTIPSQGLCTVTSWTGYSGNRFSCMEASSTLEPFMWVLRHEPRRLERVLNARPSGLMQSYRYCHKTYQVL